MSIKAKLALLISLFVIVILSLNISIPYLSSKSELQENARQQMVTIAKQIGTTLEATEKSRQRMEDSIGEKLRAVAIAAQNELDPHIDRVTNEQLVELSRKLGVDHITLWKRVPGDIVALKSSDPTEINLSSKTWEYWYTAFNQLFDKHNVDIPQGQKLPNFWAGPINISSSDLKRIDKWGYYYDGTTDYIINPYVDAKVFLDYIDNNGTNSLIRQLLADNPNILGIAGFNPQFFGKPPILKKKKGVLVENLDVRPVEFGDYNYQMKAADVDRVQLSARTGQITTAAGYAQGKHVLKSFIPLGGGMPYVVGVVFDHGVIEQALKRQLFTQSVISLALILAACLASYFMAGFLIQPLRQILRYVNEISEGRFGNKIAIKSRDELGLLSSRVNAMADNLQIYTYRLKETAEQLRGMKELLESFVNHTWDAIHVTDLQGRVIRINKAFEKMFGWTEDETYGKPLPYITGENRHEYGEIRSRILQGESVADYETVRLTKDGQTIDLSITVSPIRDESGEIVAIAEISRNITARKQSEEMVRRSEKLSVVGQLAAGVAHEIRNPLATLRGFVQLLKEKGSLSPDHLDVMLSELDRINFIVSEFLVLAKPQVARFESADLQSILNDIILLLDTQAMMSNVQVETKLAPDIPPVVCEPNQLKQVFINVLKNGIESMPEGGTITIELDRLPEVEGGVRIRIVDRGCGMSEEELRRLGEPFFTSKKTGTGLGFMVSQRIIANHKGVMNVISEPGRGTCVEIRLPLDPKSR